MVLVCVRKLSVGNGCPGVKDVNQLESDWLGREQTKKFDHIGNGRLHC